MHNALVILCVLALCSLPLIQYLYRRERKRVIGPIEEHTANCRKLAELYRQIRNEEQSSVRDHTLLRNLRAQAKELETTVEKYHG